MNSFETTQERTYHNPPVVEALCEAHFAPEGWDDNVPNKLFEAIGAEFPKRQLRTFHEAQVTISEINTTATATTDVKDLPSWVVFLTESQDKLIQVSETILTFNQLSPYLPFSEWKEYFFNAFSICKNLAPSRKVENLAVRYINHIEIPATEFPLDDYFTIMPTLPPGCGETQGPFIMKCSVPQPDDSNFLMITFRTLEPDETTKNKQTFLLDLHKLVSINKEMNDVDLRGCVEAAHKDITIAFEGSITDKTRNLFNAGKIQHG